MVRVSTRPCPLFIQDEVELDRYIATANTPGNWHALSNMRSYVREAHALSKDLRSPMQNSALIKWKTPSWVPSEARQPPKQVDPSVPVGVNTPRLTDPPEEWARWLWRYPSEAVRRPGVRRTPQGVNMSSVRGLLLVTMRAPRGDGMSRVRNTFMTRAAQLITTTGLYRRLVDELRLTIAATPGVTQVAASDNVTLEDIARLFAGDGITIPQVRDAFEWGHTALLTWSQGMDASRRTEAMLALQTARGQSSSEESDRPCPVEPRWWTPSTEQPTPAAHSLPSHATTGSARSFPSATTGLYQGTSKVPTIQPSMEVPLVEPVVGTTEGWTGTAVYYIRPKQKKKRKTRAEKRREEEEASDNEPFELEPIEERGSDNEETLPTDQGEGPSGEMPDDVVME